MKIHQFVINADLSSSLPEYLQANIEYLHTYQSVDTFLLTGEEYRYRTNSYQSYYVIVRKEQATTFVEVNCGGGGDGFFGFSLGSEDAFVLKVKALIEEYCREQSISFAETEVR